MLPSETRGGAIYVISEGEARVTGSQGQTVTHIGPGEVLGEVPALDGAPRSATVVVVTEMALIRLPAELLRELAATRACISQSLLRLVARRVYTTVQEPASGASVQTTH